MKKLLALFSLLLLVIACGPAPTAGPAALKLVTHDSFEISEATITAFQEETGHTVEIVKLGDAGEMINQSILSKNNPLGDVIFGIDNTFLSRALENNILLAHNSAELSHINDALKLDPGNHALPVDYGDVCLNYDIAWFNDNGVAPPSTLADLTDAAYAGLTVVENPATSSPGLAFLMATIDAFGEDGYLDYWTQLVANDVLVENGWSEAYYEAFSLYGGDRPIVVSYASSPPAEVFFGELDAAATGTVTSPQSCFRQIEFVGVLDGTKHEAAAKELVDFMLGTTFQEDIPMNMFVFPSNNEAELPEVFATYAEIPDEPATISPEMISAERENWISAWTDTVLR
ncbi:MAG: thiamine ABC transporter substrate-binding protein [Candidatus Promineifilaceae bacterium]